MQITKKQSRDYNVTNAFFPQNKQCTNLPPQTKHNIKGINYNLSRGVSDLYVLLTNCLRLEKHSRISGVWGKKHGVWGRKKTKKILNPIQTFSCVALNVKQQYSSVYWKKPRRVGRSGVRGRRRPATQRTNPRKSRPLMCLSTSFHFFFLSRVSRRTWIGFTVQHHAVVAQ